MNRRTDAPAAYAVKAGSIRPNATRDRFCCTVPQAPTNMGLGPKIAVGAKSPRGRTR